MMVPSVSGTWYGGSECLVLWSIVAKKATKQRVQQPPTNMIISILVSACGRFGGVRQAAPLFVESANATKF